MTADLLTDFRGIPVIRNPMIPLTKTMPDGKVAPVLCVKIRRHVAMSAWLVPLMFGPDMPRRTPEPRTTPEIHVHPDRWDAFWLAVNQPDIFMAPEVRALLGVPLETK